ncbi:MAG: D-glycero-beta-D-manno-heptose 1-phosphate adenylyltransferase [Actinomycetota bacterium]|nr:D-glycero-beta-D-manno-heptose 1-phosphate adenylyltransferase [Actinomycetota bacterium]
MSGETTASWAGLLDRFAGVEIVVVGETVLDGWYRGPSRGLSREAPVPVVRVTDQVHAPGAAANTARCAAALGARVRFLSAVGDDRDGAHARELLAADGVPVGDVLRLGGRTTVAKRRILSEAHLLVRYDTGDIGPLPAEAEERLAARLGAAVAGADLVLACDYASGLFSDALVAHLGRLVAERGVPLVVDAHDPARWAAVRPYAVKPDAEELETLLAPRELAAFRRDRLAAVTECRDALLAAAGAQLVLATLDRDGALVLQPDTPPYRVHAEALDVAHATGAGDTFTAAFAVALAAGAAPFAAAEVGGAAAAVVVRQPGTTTCALPELRDRLGSSAERLLGVERLAACVETHRALGRRIVFSNGCFDVLHRGHIAYLEAAKALGDVLIVAVNSDESVRRLKGADRPVNPVEDRAAVLAALSAVDHLVVFDGDTPADLLRLARPDVYVKGGDYTEDMLDELPEAPLVRALGGEVRIVDYVEDRSTTGLLDRVRATGPTGA